MENNGDVKMYSSPKKAKAPHIHLMNKDVHFHFSLREEEQKNSFFIPVRFQPHLTI